MARFIASLLLVVAFAAAVEGRDTGRQLLSETRSVLLRPFDWANSINASAIVSNVWVHRRLLDEDTAGRKLTGEDELQRTCDQVKCKSMCRSLTHMPGVTTPQALLRAALRVAIAKARLAKRRVDAYAATYHGGNPVASMLSACSEGYGSAADSLAETQGAIDGGHATRADLNSKLSAATTYAAGCNQAFEERPEITPPFPGVMKNTYRVVDNVLDIACVLRQA